MMLVVVDGYYCDYMDRMASILDCLHGHEMPQKIHMEYLYFSVVLCLKSVCLYVLMMVA